jgi:hypothetical protein
MARSAAETVKTSPEMIFSPKTLRAVRSKNMVKSLIL